MASINTPRILSPLPVVDFTWDPVGIPVAFSFAGNSYPPAGDRFAAFYTAVGQLITFTATSDPGVDIVQYRWDFGDGIIQYGQVTGHTYIVPNPALTVRLEALDHFGRRVHISKVLLLQFQYPTVVTGKLRIGSSDDTSELLWGYTHLWADSILVPEGLSESGVETMLGDTLLSADSSHIPAGLST